MRANTGLTVDRFMQLLTWYVRGQRCATCGQPILKDRRFISRWRSYHLTCYRPQP